MVKVKLKNSRLRRNSDFFHIHWDFERDKLSNQIISQHISLLNCWLSYKTRREVKQIGTLGSQLGSQFHFYSVRKLYRPIALHWITRMLFISLFDEKLDKDYGKQRQLNKYSNNFYFNFGMIQLIFIKLHISMNKWSFDNIPNNAWVFGGGNKSLPNKKLIDNICINSINKVVVLMTCLYD